MAKATKKLDPCDEDCRYARTGVCSFGPRNSVSCYLDNPEFFQSIIGVQEDIVKGMHSGQIDVNIDGYGGK